jgi:hypothetical protein
MAINGFGLEKRGEFNREITPVTLPRLTLLEKPTQDDPDSIERKEIAAKLAEARVVRQGQEALETVGRAASFSSWLCIGRAMMVGKSLAIRSAGNAWGQNYSKAFSAWIKTHHFDRIPAPTRSVAIELAEHADQIIRWRDALPAHRRKRLIHPLSVTRRWKAATGQYQAQRFRDIKWEAQAAWRRFVSCVSALPPDQAAPLWQAALREIAMMNHVKTSQQASGRLQPGAPGCPLRQSP